MSEQRVKADRVRIEIEVAGETAVYELTADQFGKVPVVLTVGPAGGDPALYAYETVQPSRDTGGAGPSRCECRAVDGKRRYYFAPAVKLAAM